MTWVALEREPVCETEGCCGEEICGSCTCCERELCSYELIVEGPVTVTFTPPPAEPRTWCGRYLCCREKDHRGACEVDPTMVDLDQ